MYKNTIFVYEFVRNLLKYKKIKIKKLQIWTGEICTLRCKNCSQLFPYIKPQIPIYDINSVIEYTKNLMKYCEIESFHIIGGEPFLNKEIWKLVEFVCNQEHKNINKIISNGTILPEKRTMEILAKYKNDIIINISEYKCAEEKQKNFINLCKEFNVNYSIESQNWYYCGNPEQKEF